MNFGRYEIQRELGRGGMATVYHAYDPRFRREVAIKVLPRELLHNPQFRTRFEREAQTIATLEHPAIVPVYDFGEEDGQLYLVMRLMSGGSLADMLHERIVLPLNEAVEIIERLAPALDAAHKRGIIHRDLKPGNILFDQYNNACLSDFGIVKLAEETSGLTGSGVVGTPAYMSPEQINSDGSLDGRSDIYAMGVILYEMLTGRYPYHADTPMRLAMKHLTEPIPRLTDARPDLPRSLNTILTMTLAKEREQRYSSASEMITALRAVADHSHEMAVAAPFHADDPETLASHLPPADVTYDHPPETYVRAYAVDTVADDSRAIPAPILSDRSPRLASLRGVVFAIPAFILIAAIVAIALIFGNPFTPSSATTPSTEPTGTSSTDEPAITVTTPALAAATDVTDQPTEAASPTTEVPTEPPATRITLENVGQLTTLYTLDFDPATTFEILWQPNGTMIAVGIYDRSNQTTVLVDATTGTELRRFPGAGAHSAWSPDGTLLGTSTNNGQITLWDISTFEPVRAFNAGGHFGGWSPDGSLIAFSESARGAVLLWDGAAASDTELEFFDLVHPYDVVWSPTGNQLVLAGQGFYLWDAQNGLVLEENAISAPVYSASWSPDGKRIALGQNNGLLRIWDVTLSARITQINVSDTKSINKIAWSPDGTLLAVLTAEGLHLYDAQTSDLVQKFTGEFSYGGGAAWSPDMTILVTGANNLLQIWGIAP